MHHTNRDTVEEFWNTEILKNIYENASQASSFDFLGRFSQLLETDAKFWAARSGREALENFLLAVKSPQKNRVLISSFNCPVVADAVIKAGCFVDTFDLADINGRIDWEDVSKLLKPDHCVIVVPHLFGVPTDFRPIINDARKMNIFIVEDCASTVGGRIGEYVTGTLGDAAIFSFNYDKPISLGGGGALMVNNKSLWSEINIDNALISVEDEMHELKIFIEYLEKRRDHIIPTIKDLPYKLVSRIWRFKNQQYSHGTFHITGIGHLRALLGMWQIEHYPDIVRKRNENVKQFLGLGLVVGWHVSPNVIPAWLKQKTIPSRENESGRISKHLQQKGFRVGNFNWPRTIDEYLGLPPKPISWHVARSSLDIPIHQNMNPNEFEIIRNSILS